jgi:predicted nucleic acid-binding Zn ribbon protein
MRRHAPRALSVALARVTANLEPATALARVQGCWADAVGERLAAVARPVAERDGVITFACEDAMWANELELLGPDLLEKLNTTLGDRSVAQLRFKAGDHRAHL